MSPRAGGLAAHFGTRKLDFKATAIKPGLDALVVDRTKALIEYLKVQIGVPQFATLGPWPASSTPSPRPPREYER